MLLAASSKRARREKISEVHFSEGRKKGTPLHSRRRGGTSSASVAAVSRKINKGITHTANERKTVQSRLSSPLDLLFLLLLPPTSLLLSLSPILRSALASA